MVDQNYYGHDPATAKREQNRICALYGANRNTTFGATSNAGLHLLVVVDVNSRLAPLASLHMAVEENIDFAVGAALHFRQPDPGQQEADKASCAPNITAAAAQVDTLW
jgi:hypothetical protein